VLRHQCGSGGRVAKRNHIRPGEVDAGEPQRSSVRPRDGEDEPFVDEDARDARCRRKLAPSPARRCGCFRSSTLRRISPGPAPSAPAATGLPTIGPIPGHPHVWAVLGCGGNGITYSRIAAEIIRTALAGGADPDTDLYAFT
jgi:glycine/D-amino acid oxidase-like deaminating enzyme